MKAILISGGAPPSETLLKKEVENAEYIIGIDKGIEYLYEYNMEPDIVVGDFDSVDKNILSKVIASNKELIKFPPEKDYTDTQLAINKCMELNVEEIVILGATGSRLDHTLANVGLLFQCLKQRKKAVIKDDHNTVFMIDRNSVLKAEDQGFFSLIAFGGVVKGLNITGGKYNLKDYDLYPEDNITISNEFVGEQVKISFSEGMILVVYGRD